MADAAKVEICSEEFLTYFAFQVTENVSKAGIALGQQVIPAQLIMCGHKGIYLIHEPREANDRQS